MCLEFRQRYYASLRLFLAVSCLSVLAAMPAVAEQARIAVAANFLATAQKLQSAYEAVSGNQLQLVAGASGHLYGQIAKGAPYDLFLSADQAYPQRLIDETARSSGPLVDYALGRLALYSARSDFVVEDPYKTLAKMQRRLALADPRLAPYGRAAQEVLDRLAADASTQNSNITREALVPAGYVYGTSIAQSFAMIHSGAAEAGFVAYSQIIQAAENGDNGSYWLVPDDMHMPVTQSAILLAHGNENEAAIGFLAYLQTSAAHQVIEKAGYLLPTNRPQADQESN